MTQIVVVYAQKKGGFKKASFIVVCKRCLLNSTC